MKTKTITLYAFNELARDVQQDVLRKYVDIGLHPDWWDNVYHDFHALAHYVGIDVDLKRTYFTGFYHQGQGAAFTAQVDVGKLIPAMQARAWTEYASDGDFNSAGVKRDMLRVARLIVRGAIDWPVQVRPTHRETSIAVEGFASLYGQRRDHANIESFWIRSSQLWMHCVAP